MEENTKDKLALIKELISLVVVTLGLMGALMSNTIVGILRDVKIDPITLSIIIALLGFLMLLFVRLVFGDEKYQDFKKKALETAKDLAVIIVVIALIYSGGRYAMKQINEDIGKKTDAADLAAARKTAADKDAKATLSTVKLKDKPEKDKKKAELKDAEEQSALKTAKNKNDGSSAHSKTAKAKEDAKKQKDENKKHGGEEAIAANAKKDRGTAEVTVIVAKKGGEPTEVKISEKPNVKDETVPEKALSSGHAETYEIKVTKKPEETVEVKISGRSGETAEIKTVKPAAAETAKTAEVSRPVEKAPATSEIVLNTPKISVDEGKGQAAKKVDEAPKTSEAAVNATVQPQTPAKAPEAVKPEENQSVVINVVGTDPAEISKKTNTVKPEEIVETVTINVSDSEEIPLEEVTADPDKTTSEIGFSIKGPTENANDSKLVVEKKFGLDEAGRGVKKAGTRVIKGGADVIEKTGQGIKKGVDKIKNIFNN